MNRSSRVRRRAAPLVILAAASLVAGVVAGVRHQTDTERTGRAFATAWQRGDYERMWELIDETARAGLTVEELRSAYADAMATSTGTAVAAGEIEDADGTARVAVTIRTRVFGPLRGNVELPVVESRVAWEPHMAFPGLARGEDLTRDTRAPRRAPILGRGGERLVEGPAQARTSPLGAAGDEIAGALAPPTAAPEQAALYARGFPPDTPVGISGLERILEEQVAGRPGGRLLAGERVIASSEPRPAEPVRTTIDVRVQEAATVALAGRFGGVAALDARTGEVRALAGIAFSAPQPPGSVFKIVTASAALERGLVRPAKEFPVETAAIIEGFTLQNANGEACGGTFVESFAHSCNSVFAPLGVELGAEALTEMAERYGFNGSPTLAGEVPSTMPQPDQIVSDLELGATAIGQGRVLATPLLMASVAQTVASGGVRRTPTLLPRAAGSAPEVRVTERRVARQLERMMVAVVDHGTGTAASLAPVGVAGKTGTAELEDTTDSDVPTDTDTDAWFTAYAPVRDPELAVAVLLVRHGTGGATAAPAARVVLEAGLAR